LPETFSLMLIGDLFKAPSEPWVEIANAYLLEVWTRAKKHVKTILASLMDREAMKRLLELPEEMSHRIPIHYHVKFENCSKSSLL
jgi:hypothetical protein